MSEEKKEKVELKEEDLEKVSGGGLAEQPEKKFECDICHMKFSDQDSFNRHKTEKHPGYGPDKVV